MNALTTCQSNQPLKGYSNLNDWKLLELRKLTASSCWIGLIKQKDLDMKIMYKCCPCS